VGDFFDTYVFGPGRAALVAGQLPVAQADADRDRYAEMRTRTFDWFAELRAEREQLQIQLDAIDTTTGRPADIGLLDRLPLAANPLPPPDPSA
jgi:hypothetical protein